MNNPEDLKNLRDYSKLTYEELRKKIGDAFAIDPVRPGKDKSTFNMQLNKDWLTNSDFIDIEKPIEYKVGEWSIFSVVKSRAIMVQLAENSYILDPSEQLLRELYKHIR